MGAKASCATCQQPNAKFDAFAEAKDLAGLEAILEAKDLSGFEAIVGNDAENFSRALADLDDPANKEYTQALAIADTDLKPILHEEPESMIVWNNDAPDIKPIFETPTQTLPLNFKQLLAQDPAEIKGASIGISSSPKHGGSISQVAPLQEESKEKMLDKSSTKPVHPRQSKAVSKVSKKPGKSNSTQKSSGTSANTNAPEDERKNKNHIHTKTHEAEPERKLLFTKEDLERRKQMWKDELKVCMDVFRAKNEQMSRGTGVKQSGLEVMGETMQTFARDIAANKKTRY